MGNNHIRVQESTSRRNIISNMGLEILGKVKTVDDSFYTSREKLFTNP